MDGMLGRLWMNLIGRIGGPLTFRLVLQTDDSRRSCASRRVEGCSARTEMTSSSGM